MNRNGFMEIEELVKQIQLDTAEGMIRLSRASASLDLLVSMLRGKRVHLQGLERVSSGVVVHLFDQRNSLPDEGSE